MFDYHAPYVTSEERLAWLDGWALVKCGIPPQFKIVGFVPLGFEARAARGIPDADLGFAFEAGKRAAVVN